MHTRCASEVRPSQPEPLADSNQDLAMVKQEIKHQGLTCQHLQLHSQQMAA